jgi:hypothetical protein
MEVLPGTSPPADPDNTYWSITGLAALSATNVFVSALETIGSGPGAERRDTGYFAHFDGKSWRQLALPVPGGLRALWSHPSGALYGSDATDQLWSASKAEPGAPWTRVTFPAQIVHDSSESTRLLQLWLHAPGDVWAHVQVGVEGKGARSYLLHTRPAVNALPTFEAFKRTDAELALPGPPVDWCQTPFVLLYTLGRNAPANYDYPSTRAALKGHREFENEAAFIEFQREGRRYFGARVSDFKLGKRLATLVKDKVPGATPQLVCHEPAPLRTLDIDLVTGEIKSTTAP